MTGSITVAGQDARTWTAARRVQTLGFVDQDPESTAVYDVVEREVAFALENLGVSRADMAWRVAEALELVGLSPLAGRSVTALSGGERQRLAVAGAIVHQPHLLLLDEPTSQLDPVSTHELLDCLGRLRDDFGMTILMSEHHLDAVYARVDAVLYMQAGQILDAGAPHQLASRLRTVERAQVPTLARLFPDDDPELTVRDVRKRIAGQAHRSSQTGNLSAASGQPPAAPGELPAAPGAGAAQPAPRPSAAPAISLTKVTVRYSGATEPALDACTAEFPSGGLTAVIGANGSGKTTLLRVLAGVQTVSEGRVSYLGAGSEPRRGDRWRLRRTEAHQPTIGYLPQKPSELFSQLTVAAELQYGLELRHLPAMEVSARVADAIAEFGLAQLVNRSPRDVSGGEQMRVALASLWLTQPSVLLLDEPTRGLDARQKQELGGLLQRRIQADGTTVVLVTHDLEFVAEFAEQVLFLHRGRRAMAGDPQQVFARALAFAPPIARALRGCDPTIQCLRDAIAAGWAR